MPAAVALRSPDGTALAALHHDAGEGTPAVVVVPGLGSRKENHGDFAALLGARGMSALVLDVRGHGASGGGLDAGAVDDVVAALDWLADRGHGPLGVRGSSMGGFLALHAAARHPAARAVVAICPARPETLVRRTPTPWPLSLPLEPAVSRGDVARGFWHARGDEVVPWTGTWDLARRAAGTSRLRIVMGGHHRSLQHDPAVMAETAAFLGAHLGGPS